MQKVRARERIVHVRTLFSRCQEKVSVEIFVEDLWRSPGLSRHCILGHSFPAPPPTNPRQIPAGGLKMHLGGRDGLSSWIRTKT